MPVKTLGFWNRKVKGKAPWYLPARPHPRRIVLPKGKKKYFLWCSLWPFGPTLGTSMWQTLQVPALAPGLWRKTFVLRPDKGSQYHWEPPQGTASQWNLEEGLWFPFCLAHKSVTAFGADTSESGLCRGRRDQNRMTITEVRCALKMHLIEGGIRIYILTCICKN